MKLAEATWQDVRDFDRNAVVLIPTGSLEQHGPHLPLFTDSILATAVAEAVEHAIPDRIVLTPTLWLGASAHHMAFAGSTTASFGTYIGALQDVVESQLQHGFTRFFVLNGHGGNSEPNGIAMRELKVSHPSATFVHSNYYTFAEEHAARVLEGPAKRIQHACEAEASLILHVRPELVRKEKLRDDGLKAEPPITGLVTHFDEITEEGSLGYATLASAEKGKAIFEAAVAGVIANAEAIFKGHVFVG
ncbi:MAG TPA: creatininase family protein [Fimbriimonadaceae bacterium]|nr:creatininase family protein [Fimbriimonadaceae bacterium]